MAQLGGRVEAGHHRRVRPRLRHPDRAPPTRSSPASSPTGREEVWMSHGDRVTALAPGFAVDRHLARTRPSPSPPTPRGTSTPCSSTPRCTTRRTARGSCKNFTDLAGFTGDWTMAAYKDQAIAAIRAQVGDAQGDLRPLRRRRQLGRRGADPRGDRRPAHLRLRRHRPDAPGRGRGGRDAVPRPLQHPADPRRRERPLPRRARRRRGPRGQAQDHRPPLHRGLREARARRSATPSSSPRARSTPT